MALNEGDVFFFTWPLLFSSNSYQHVQKQCHQAVTQVFYQATSKDLDLINHPHRNQDDHHEHTQYIMLVYEFL